MRPRAFLATGLTAAMLMVGCDAAAPGATPSAPTPSATEAAASLAPAESPAPSTTPSIAPPAATSLSTPVVGTKRGRLQLSTVLSADGAPLAGAPITISMAAQGNTYQVLTLKGVVPKPAKSLIVQIGFNNLPGGSRAKYDVRIYGVTFADGGRARNRLPNGGFDSGLYHWAVYGQGTVTTPKSDRGDGRLLRLRAAPNEEIVLNSYGIPVTTESNYRMTVAAQVPPSGSASGYVAAIFLRESEIWRDTLNLVGAPIPASSFETGPDGSISVDAAMPAGRYLVTVLYPGDSTHQLVRMEQEVTVG